MSVERAGSETATTRERMLQRYHSLGRRPSLEDPATRRTVFKSFRRTLGEWLPPERGTRVLDVGCGEGALLLFLRESGYLDLHGFGLSPENVDLCHAAGLAFVREFDALRLGEYDPDLLFDLIIALDIVEHLPKQAAAGFLELARSRLRAGGRLIIQTPNLGSVQGAFIRYNDLTHEFGLTENTVVDLLSAAGFEVSRIEIRPAWNATTAVGHLREIWLRLLHFAVFVAEGSGRPRIPTKNLLVRASRA
jgi:2-polyprenyl-3-methyl-5-hydroxy-6-metoxy-1,4-benzoquinol methylase